MKMNKLTALLLSVVLLFAFSTASSASTPLNHTDTVTGQGDILITGTAYFSNSPPAGIIFADVYRIVNGVEEYVTSGRSNIYTNPSVVNYTITFNTSFTQGTYKIRYSYAGTLADLTTYARFV
ncbi:hypothetical protein [Cohnella hongkongensis]|uniref:Uncharacterized protein n=1 Tax=Cohnella hongkongensis TaxID=178337 RepID=A0ABV9FDC3_9BACL